MSVKMEQILQILDRMHDNYPDSRLPISQIRLKSIRLNAVTAVAEAHGVDITTVSATYIRGLRPEVEGTNAFDCLVGLWLRRGSARLPRVLARHADRYDRRRIGQFFALHPTPRSGRLSPLAGRGADRPPETAAERAPTAQPRADVIAEQGAGLLDQRPQLLGIWNRLLPDGFEKLCRLLIKRCGFERVSITNRLGNRGIDVLGTLNMYPLVSIRALFQCRRGKRPIRTSEVQGFRAATGLQADKRVIITPGTFSEGARIEANTACVPPIDLVDGDRLVDLFESLGLGLHPGPGFKIDHSFFDDYR
jgi:hypothetical protein